MADEKVAGKRLRIRCKQCSAIITLVDGSAARESDFPPEGDLWFVYFPEDGQQREITKAEVVAAFCEGVVTHEAYCWAEPMGDWLPLPEIRDLAEACRKAMMAAGSRDLVDGRYDAAISAFERAQSVAVLHPEPRLAEGEALLRKGDATLAEVRFKLCLHHAARHTGLDGLKEVAEAKDWLARARVFRPLQGWAGESAVAREVSLTCPPPRLRGT